MNDLQFRRLLVIFGRSWRGYRKVRKGVIKRIYRHMMRLQVDDFDDYLIAIEKNDKARRQCELMLTVSISRFFRDRKLWEILQNRILPGLIEKSDGKIDVWGAGCASGEEIYSLKIVLEELRSTFKGLPRITITATDINPQYLNRAMVGVYPPSSLRELCERLKRRYFRYNSNTCHYAVNDSLTRDIEWQIHNFLEDPPAKRFDLIFLRNNLLTYYEHDTQILAMEKIIASLSKNGSLIIGAHEKLPLRIKQLVTPTQHRFIFTMNPG